MKFFFFNFFREIVDKNPTPQSYLLLGDAYMSIQEPERAIEVNFLLNIIQVLF